MSIELLVCWITGIAVGILLAAAVVTVKSSFGTFRIDMTDPEKDIYRLDIHGSLPDVHNKKWIMLRVDSQE